MKSSTLALVLLAGLALATPAAAQSAITCTDATATNCTAKKNQPFKITADANADGGLTEKYRLYLDGAKLQEAPAVAGVAPLFTFAAGLATPGDHTFYLEALTTGFDATGAPSEISSGPSNTVVLHVITGSPTAPKNVKIVK